MIVHHETVDVWFPTDTVQGRVLPLHAAGLRPWYVVNVRQFTVLKQGRKTAHHNSWNYTEHYHLAAGHSGFSITKKIKINCKVYFLLNNSPGVINKKACVAVTWDFSFSFAGIVLNIALICVIIHSERMISNI